MAIEETASIHHLHQPKRPKTGAERAAAYRARKRAAAVTSQPVMPVTPAVASPSPVTPATSPPVTPSRRNSRVPRDPDFSELETSTAELVAACGRGLDAARSRREPRPVIMSAIEAALYGALVRAVDHLEGEDRLVAMAAIARAEGE